MWVGCRPDGDGGKGGESVYLCSVMMMISSSSDVSPKAR
jgi:hypothetical protein